MAGGPGERAEGQRQRHASEPAGRRSPGLNEKLRATQAQLRNTVYAAHMNLAHNAWDTGGIGRVVELSGSNTVPSRGKRTCVVRNGSSLPALPLRPAHPQGAHWLMAATWPTAPTASAWPAVIADKWLKVWDAQTARNSLPSRGTLPKSGWRGLQPGRQTPGQRLWGQNGEGVGWPDRSGTPDLQGAHRGAVGAWPSSGKRLASASGDKTVKVWDAQTGKELLSLKRSDPRNVYSVAFSPDGKRLAAPLPRTGGGASQGVGCPDRPGTPLPQGELLPRGLQPGRQTPGER